jgi:hypothetical protein
VADPETAVPRSPDGQGEEKITRVLLEVRKEALAALDPPAAYA